MQQLRVIAMPHRIVDATQHSGGGGNAREQIDHHQVAIAPVAREAAEAAQGRIIPLAIGSGGIQPQKQKCALP